MGPGEVFYCLCNSELFLFCDRELEKDVETVIKVLQPGPLGITEHKFSAEEISRANATVAKAVANWRRNAILEDNNNRILKDYIHK